MKTHLFSKRTAVISLAAALALAGITLGQPGPPEDRGHRGPMPMSQSPRSGMQQHRVLMEKIKANDEKLLSQVESLAGATTEAKVDLLASIVTTLVQDRNLMHSQMEMMMMHMPMSPDEIDQADKMQSIAKKPSDKDTAPKPTE